MRSDRLSPNKGRWRWLELAHTATFTDDFVDHARLRNLFHPGAGRRSWRLDVGQATGTCTVADATLYDLPHQRTERRTQRVCEVFYLALRRLGNGPAVGQDSVAFAVTGTVNRWIVGSGMDAGRLNSHMALVRWMYRSRGYFGDIGTNSRSIALSS